MLAGIKLESYSGCCFYSIKKKESISLVIAIEGFNRSYYHNLLALKLRGMEHFK